MKIKYWKNGPAHVRFLSKFLNLLLVSVFIFLLTSNKHFEVLRLYFGEHCVFIHSKILSEFPCVPVSVCRAGDSAVNKTNVLISKSLPARERSG